MGSTTPIGNVGKTGSDDYPYHLHFEIRKDGAPIDPKGTTVEKELKK
jgi:septal ring factor EnvC (AmiA/AmiB activator)